MGPSDELRAVATALVEGCRTGNETDNLDALYSETAVSVEAFAMPDSPMPRATEGLVGIKGKHAWWNANMEVLPDSPTGAESAEGPFYHGDDKFTVIFRFKVKDKNSGDVMDMVETGTYLVEHGKIVREEFFWAM